MTKKNNAFIIALILKEDRFEFEEDIDELKQLSTTLGYNIVNTFVQKRNQIDINTYIGKGKIKSIINKCYELNISTLIFNNELKPSHYKNINKITDNSIEIIDRTKLILDIFKNHAKTNESKKQVELAMNEYLLPRLKGMWTHLERQMGGIGTRGGPGEKQIEIDRRLINRSITKLKKDLSKIEISRKTMRKNRNTMFKISLVGYTNAGKSTIMKELSGFNSFIKDQLFATLDTTTKQILLNKKYKVLLSDTVGFLNNLPHSLIASFKSTLEEIKSADLIIKIIDISTPSIEKHYNTINETLKIIGSINQKELLVFNKIDLLKNKNVFKKIKKTYNDPIMISAEKKLKLNHLIDSIINIIEASLNTYTVKISYGDYELLNYLHSNMNVIKERHTKENVEVIFKCTKYQYLAFVKKNKNP